MGQITLQGVQKSFGPVHIIKGADLDIADGSFVVFVGPSGCGKTTLLRLIAGLEDVTGGSILIDGKNVVRSEEHTSELQSQFHLVCRLLLEKKKSQSQKRR